MVGTCANLIETVHKTIKEFTSMLFAHWIKQFARRKLKVMAFKE